MSLRDLDETEEGDCNLNIRKEEVLVLHTYLHNYTMLARNSPVEAKVQEHSRGKSTRAANSDREK